MAGSLEEASPSRRFLGSVESLLCLVSRSTSFSDSNCSCCCCLVQAIHSHNMFGWLHNSRSSLNPVHPLLVLSEFALLCWMPLLINMWAGQLQTVTVRSLAILSQCRLDATVALKTPLTSWLVHMTSCTIPKLSDCYALRTLSLLLQFEFPLNCWLNHYSLNTRTTSAYVQSYWYLLLAASKSHDSQFCALQCLPPLCHKHCSSFLVFSGHQQHTSWA